jgi:hypothetical protein
VAVTVAAAASVTVAETGNAQAGRACALSVFNVVVLDQSR